MRGDASAQWHYDDAGRHYETENRRTYKSYLDDYEADLTRGQESSVTQSKHKNKKPSLSGVSYNSTVSQKALFLAANRRLLDVYSTDAIQKKKDTSKVNLHDQNSLLFLNDELIQMKQRHAERIQSNAKVAHANDVNRHGYMHSVQHNQKRLKALYDPENQR